LKHGLFSSESKITGPSRLKLSPLKRAQSKEVDASVAEAHLTP
jgi:hypothetical protein